MMKREELEALYAESAAALDDGEFDRWVGYFADECSYTITTKENFDRGWPIGLLSCETRGMLLDRIAAVQKTLYYIPRIQRRIQSGILITGTEGALTRSRGSFAVFETRVGEHTSLFAAGRFLDTVCRQGESLKFAKRLCILDASLVPNSLPFPI